MSCLRKPETPGDLLTDLEVAAGFPLGREAGAEGLPAPTVTSRQAAEANLLKGLLRPPLFVSFSGGRDSSAVLALAVHVARREGLPLPVPLTLDFPGAQRAAEEEWQRSVLDAVGITQGERLVLGTEMNLLGPTARAVLGRLGLKSPPNLYLHAPLLELARGGSLATGIGGDEMLGSGDIGPTALVVARRKSPSRHDLRVLAFQLLARPLARHVWERRRERSPWLLPRSDSQQLHRQSQLWQPEWKGWAPLVEVYAGSRDYWVRVRAFAALAASYDVQPLHPFFDRSFMSALSHEGGRLGPGDRTAAMTSLVGDLLPAPVLSRQSKAEFGEIVSAGEAATFRRRAALGSVRNPHVDLDRLREQWMELCPPFGTGLLLQKAWLDAGQPPLEAA